MQPPQLINSRNTSQLVVRKAPSYLTKPAKSRAEGGEGGKRDGGGGGRRDGGGGGTGREGGGVMRCDMNHFFLRWNMLLLSSNTKHDSPERDKSGIRLVKWLRYVRTCTTPGSVRRACWG